MYSLNVLWPIPVAARSKAWACGRSLAGIAGSNPLGGMDVCLFVMVVCCQVRGLCDGPITRPQESYRVCVCVCVCVCVMDCDQVQQ
jgi:hypothetical protein